MQNNTEASPPPPTDPEQGSGPSAPQPATEPTPAAPSAPSTSAPNSADQGSVDQSPSGAQPVAAGYPASGYAPTGYPPRTYPSGPYASGPAGTQYPAGSYPPGQYAGATAGQPGASASGAWSTPGPSTAPGQAYPGGGYATMPPSPAQTAYGPPGGYPPARRLTRSQDDRVVGGVLGGLARYWNTDPLLLRILTIVLTIATGGALLLGYIIAWIVIPLETSTGGPSGSAGYAAGGNPAYVAPGSTPGETAYDAAPRPPRSYLGWLVVSIGLIVAGILAVIGLWTEPTSGFAAFVCAVVLIVLGAGLIAGAWYGRARWLIIFAVPMVFVTMAAVAANAWVQSPSADRWIASPDGGISVGSRVWTVTPADTDKQPLEYQVTAGDAQLDLTQLTALDGAEDGRPRQRVTINAGVGLGQLMVTIPEDMQVNLSATVKAGAVAVPADLPGQAVVERSGTDLTVNTTIESVTEGQPAYVVDLDVAIGAGNVEVRREAS